MKGGILIIITVIFLLTTIVSASDIKHSDNELNYHGYIVQFKENPAISKWITYEKKLRSEEELALKTKDFTNLRKLENKINKEVKSQRLKILKEHKALKISKEKIVGEYVNVFNGVALDISDEEAKEIKKLKNVKNVYPNYEVKAELMNSVKQINANEVWKLKDADGSYIKGKDVTIGIIDTGVDYTHPDLGGCFGVNCKVIGGYDFVNYDNNPIDDHGHGTHVASIAAGNGVLKGVAPDAKLYAYKVLSKNGWGTFDNVIKAIERSVDPNKDGDFSDHLDIISLSLGGFGNPDDAVSQAIDNAVNLGVIAIIAAGNNGPGENTILSPGTARKAITVGAIDKENKIASFSSRGPVIWKDKNNNTKTINKPDIVAPGVNICAAQYDSAWNDKKCFDDKHVAISGTSMATPHVAGAIALIKQLYPDLGPDEIKEIIMKKAVNLNYGINEQGAGKLDAYLALNFNPTVNIINCEGKYIKNLIGGTYEHLPECGLAYNFRIEDGFATGRYGPVSVKFNFTKTYVNKVSIYSGPYFQYAYLGLSDGTSKSLGTLNLNAWNEIKVDKGSLEWINISWSAGGHKTGLYEIKIDRDPRVKIYAGKSVTASIETPFMENI